LVLVFAMVAAACGPKQTRPTTDGGVPWAKSGIDWSKPPAVAETTVAMPRIAERKVGDVRVLVVENHRLPFVAITAVNDEAGGRAVNDLHPGLAGLTLEVLGEAAPKQAGIRLDTALATDYASVHVIARREDAARAGASLVDVLRKPVFEGALVERVRARRVAMLRDRQTRQRTLAGQAFDGTVFFGHPYRMPAEGLPDDVAKLTFTHIVDFHTSHYGPKQLTLVIAGDVDAKMVDSIARGFAGWSGGPKVVLPALTVPTFQPKLVYVDIPGAKEVSVLVGVKAHKAGERTQAAADIENALFGGGPASRLDRKLQDEMAITTGAGASFWRGHYAGSWSVSATFSTAKAAEGLRAVLAEIEKARGADASDDEVGRAKHALARALSNAFETTTGTARALERMAGLRLPIDWFGAYLDALRKVNARDARAAVSGTWKQPTIAIAGDWAKLKDEVSSLGYTVTPYTP
jgi:zinc protease